MKRHRLWDSTVGRDEEHGHGFHDPLEQGKENDDATDDPEGASHSIRAGIGGSGDRDRRGAGGWPDGAESAVAEAPGGSRTSQGQLRSSGAPPDPELD